MHHIEQIARDYSGKSATVTFYDVRQREVWAWTALLFLGIGLLPFSYAGLSAAWKGFGHRSATSHDLPSVAA